MQTTTEITEAVARKVLTTIDAGLVEGAGKPIPGQMCVEAAVCYALGLPHGDDPACVAPALRLLKIALNDRPWSSPDARAKGLRRLGVAQLGSAGVLNEKEFAKRVAELAIRTCVPVAMRSAASVHNAPKHKAKLLEAANKCEIEPTRKNALAAAKAAANATYAAANAAKAAAYAAANAADDAYAAADARDKTLATFAEGVVQILIKMGAPGCRWLFLTEAA